MNKALPILVASLLIGVFSLVTLEFATKPASSPELKVNELHVPYEILRIGEYHRAYVFHFEDQWYMTRGSSSAILPIERPADIDGFPTKVEDPTVALH